MLTDPLTEALEAASSQQPYVPDVGEAVRRGRRLRQQRHRTAVVAATLATAALVSSLIIALPRSGHENATVRPVPVTSSTPAPDSPSSPRAPADPSLVAQITNLPDAAFSTSTPGTSGANLTKVSGAPLTARGKPLVFWEGAEYCPFCAVQRWPLVIALSRFGSWSGLSTITSASSDKPSSIATFSFYGASYSSPYVSLQSVELETNVRSGNLYTPLQTPTSKQSALLSRYNHEGSIPFIDFGNVYTLLGSSYDYSVLQGKSAREIANEIADPSTDTSKAVISTANEMTAAICHLTGNKPTSVCDTPAVTALHR